MKKTKVFGAVLCSAALAAGMAMPAFAANSVNDVNNVTGGTIDPVSKKQTTEVYMAGLGADQINATIPVTVTIAAAVNGGNISAPGADKYTIVNNGSKDLKLNSVVPAQQGDFVLVDSTTQATDFAADDDTKHSLFLNIQFGNSATKYNLVSGSGITGLNTANYTVKAGDKSGLGITLSGDAKPNSSGFSADKAESCVKITYTVATV